MLKTIIIEGSIGALVGREWRLDVDTPNEAARAINALTDGKFVRALNAQVKTHDGYYVHVDAAFVASEEEYFGPSNAETIVFEPVLKGSGKKDDKSIMQIVVGVVLIIVGAVLTYFNMPQLGEFAINMGISMVLGGVAGLLTPTPKYKEEELERSTTLGGIVNTTKQGLPVPVGYGEMIIGSQMISVGVMNMDSTIDSTAESPQYVDEYETWLYNGATGTYEEFLAQR